jgi:CheY-like chemotaxis protein
LSRILVADDDPNVRRAVRLILESAGHEVHDASDGGLAVALAHLLQPDLLLCDVFMPEMDGIETLHEFCNRFPTVPVVMISGGGSGQFANLLPTAKLLGAARVIPKPFGRDVLLAAVAELVDGKPAA